MFAKKVFVVLLSFFGIILLFSPPLEAFTLENAHYRLTVSEISPVKLTEVFNKGTSTACLEGAASSIFGVIIDGRVLTADSFRVVKSSLVENSDEKRVFTLQLWNEEEDIRAELTLSADQSPEVVLELSLTNQSNKSRSLRVLFPLFDHLRAGNSLEDTTYFFPYMHGWVSNKPYEIAIAYGLIAGSLQVVDLFNPSDGSNLYYWVKDDTGRLKTFYLRKTEKRGRRVPVSNSCGEETKIEERFLNYDRGITLITQSWPYHFGANQRVTMPQVILGIGRGNWREALNSYTGWVRTWWKAPSVPVWQRACYGYAVSHDFVGGYGFESGFINNNKWVLAEKANPSIDHRIQLGYWHDHSFTDHEGDTRDYKWYKHTIGDYLYEESWGGLPALKKAIAETQNKGIPVVLYLSCPTLTWKYGEAAKRFSEAKILDKEGKEPRWWWAETPTGKTRYLDICPQVEEWQDYLAETAGRVVRDTGCLGIYLDTANTIPICYNPNHKHYQYPSVAAERYLKKIRTAVKAANPDCAVEVEDVCSDYLMQWIDGSWSKTFGGEWLPQNQEFDAYGVSFLRFYFPEIYFAEWGSMWEYGAKRTFFNGMGYCRNDPVDTKDETTGRIITREEKMAWFARACTIFKENGDAFTSLNPVPLVPTLKDKVYANMFPASGKTVYTFFNKSGGDVEGQIISVPATPEEHFVEFFSGEELPVFFQEGVATLSFRIKKNEIACVGKLKKRIEITRQDNGFCVSVTDFDPVKEKVFLSSTDHPEETHQLSLKDGQAFLSKEAMQKQRLTLKLIRDGFLSNLVTITPAQP